MKPTIFIMLLIAIQGITGCATTPRIQQANIQVLTDSGYDFIRDNISTREELLAKLGPPFYMFEGNRILIYRFKNGKVVLPVDGGEALTDYFVGFKNIKYNAPSHICSLVLVFREAGILKKHSLVVSK